MQIEITGHNIKVSDHLRDLTEKKLHRLCHHYDHITHVHIVFRIDKLEQTAEGQLSVPGQILHASATSESVFHSVDLLMDKLLRQVTKHKEKSMERN